MDRHSSQAEPGKAGDEQAALQALIEKTILAQAANLARAGRYAEAEAALREALREREASPALLDLLARIHAQQGHWKEAEAAWKLALEHRPDSKVYAAGLKRIAQARKWGRLPYLLPFIVTFILIIVLCLAGRRFLVFPPHPAPTATPTATATETPLPSPTLTAPPTATLFLTPTASPPPTQVLTAVPTPVTCTVTEPLNVRSGPGMDYDPIGYLQTGEQVEILNYKDLLGKWRWLHILRKPDFVGWVSSEYCK